jgi:hypothetical protein
MTRPLFDDIPIGEAFERQRRKMTTAVAELPAEVFQTRSLYDLAAELVDAYRIDPLVLNWDGVTAEVRQAEISVSADAKLEISSLTGPATVSGREITHFVPFSGAPGLFDMRPLMQTGDPPHGLVRGAELLISYSGVDADPATFQSEFDRQEANVKTWVAAIKTDVDAFNTDLARQVRAQLKARFVKTRADADLLAALGIPLHQHHPTRREDIYAGRRSRAAAPHESAPDLRRSPGRPGWTRELFEEHWREALALTPEPQTYTALAGHFRGRDGTLGSVSGEHLGRLRRKWLPD